MKGCVKFSIVNTYLKKIVFPFYFINWPIPASVWCCIFLLTLLIKIDFLDTKINRLERKNNNSLKMDVYQYCTSPYCWKLFSYLFLSNNLNTELQRSIIILSFLLNILFYEKRLFNALFLSHLRLLYLETIFSIIVNLFLSYLYMLSDKI